MIKLDGLKIAREIAVSRDGKCLSKIYINSNFKLKWKCNNNHIWLANLHSVKDSETWCLECKINNTKNSIEMARQIAEKNKGKCLSNKYINNYSNLKWECENGHIWLATLHNTKDSGWWCKKCSGKTKLSIRIAQQIARERKGKCLSKKYIDGKSPLLWECENNHKWKAALGDIKNHKTWCPFCRNFTTQNELQKIIEDILNIKAVPNYRDFEWLKNPKTNRKLEIDIWFPNIKLAVEYDGKQHFKAIKFFGGENRLLKSKKRDRLKNKKIKQHSEDIKYFIRFNYKENITPDYVYKKINELGVI